MDAVKITEELKAKYPGKKIVANSSDKPTEIICEIEKPTGDNQASVQVAVIDEAVKHVHQDTTEIYEVLNGELIITKDSKTYTMKPGESFAVHPNEEHSIEGHTTWVKVTSIPSWSDERHVVIEDEK